MNTVRTHVAYRDASRIICLYYSSGVPRPMDLPTYLHASFKEKWVPAILYVLFKNSPN